MGKLMETEMTLRPKFESGTELRRVQDKVIKGLSFLEELRTVSAQLGILDGLVFQEMLALLNTMGPGSFATATTPASPTIRALRQENQAMVGNGAFNGGGGRAMVGRTPLAGATRPIGGQAVVAQRPMQAKVETLGYERMQSLVRNVAGLRGLVRIKIEDNGDLALAKKALEEAMLVFDNLWATASELPASSPGSPQETSWPPCPGEDPSLDHRVTGVLEKLRCID